jgi:hypothetical protein
MGCLIIIEWAIMLLSSIYAQKSNSSPLKLRMKLRKADQLMSTNPGFERKPNHSIPSIV